VSPRTSRPNRRLTDAGFVLDTRTLGRRPGTMRELARSIPLESRIGLDLIGIEVGSTVEMAIRLEAVSEGVLVNATIHADVVGECGRCLEPFDDVLDLQVMELFAYPDSATDQTTEEDEMYRVVDDFIDLEPVVIDAVGLGLPLQPVCSPDCLGLCAECGVRLAIAGSEHSHEILDPRWAGLAAKLSAAGSASNERIDQVAEEK